MFVSSSFCCFKPSEIIRPFQQYFEFGQFGQCPANFMVSLIFWRHGAVGPFRHIFSSWKIQKWPYRHPMAPVLSPGDNQNLVKCLVSTCDGFMSWCRHSVGWPFGLKLEDIKQQILWTGDDWQCASREATTATWAWHWHIFFDLPRSQSCCLVGGFKQFLFSIIYGIIHDNPSRWRTHNFKMVKTTSCWLISSEPTCCNFQMSLPFAFRKSPNRGKISWDLRTEWETFRCHFWFPSCFYSRFDVEFSHHL